MMPHFFLNFVWNPNRELFEIPLLGHPITWYGLFFTMGFMAGYVIVRFLLKFYLLSKEPQIELARKATHLTDQVTLYVVFGAVIGARLGHVLFYEWSYYAKDPLSIIKVWEGGLASHGGAIGVLVGLMIFAFQNRKSGYSFFVFLDALAVAAAFAGGCIRLGNFINQEILGKPTTLPWGVTFLHPLEDAPPVPLHPVQLYESFAYFLTFMILLGIWRKTHKSLGRGVIAGWFFILVFTSRFMIEFLKLPQTPGDHFGPFNMGQLLSLPFILAGIILLVVDHTSRKKT